MSNIKNISDMSIEFLTGQPQRDRKMRCVCMQPATSFNTEKFLSFWISDLTRA